MLTEQDKAWLFTVLDFCDDHRIPRSFAHTYLQAAKVMPVSMYCMYEIRPRTLPKYRPGNVTSGNYANWSKLLDQLVPLYKEKFSGCIATTTDKK